MSIVWNFCNPSHESLLYRIARYLKIAGRQNIYVPSEFTTVEEAIMFITKPVIKPSWVNRYCIILNGSYKFKDNQCIILHRYVSIFQRNPDTTDIDWIKSIDVLQPDGQSVSGIGVFGC